MLPEDAGEYRVAAINSAGEVTSACRLDVIGELNSSKKRLSKS